MSDSAQRAYKDFGESAQKVGGHDNKQPFERVVDYVRFGIVQRGKRAREYHRRTAYRRKRDHKQKRTLPHSGKDSLFLARAVVLPDDGGSRGGNGVHRHVRKRFDAARRARRRHKFFAERVYLRLNHYVCDREKTAQYSGRNADSEDFFYFRAVETKFFKRKFTFAFFADERDNHENRRQKLGGDRRYRHALDVHFEYDDEKYIKYHVETARDREVNKRAGRVAFRPKNRRAEVVYDVRDRAEKDYFEVQRRFVEHRRVRFHPDERGAGDKVSEHAENRAGYERERHRRMYRAFGFIAVFCADRLRHKHVRADAQSEYEVYYKVIKRRRRTHRRKRIRAGKLSYYDKIRRRKQQLKDSGEYHRNGQFKYFRKKRTFRHVHCFRAHFGLLSAVG